MDKTAAFFGESFRHGGQLFTPSHHFYRLDIDQDLESTAKEVFSWLGMKPGHVYFRYGAIDRAVSYQVTEEGGVVLINQQLRSSPFESGAAITYMVMLLFAARRRQMYPEPFLHRDLINYLLVEAGLGLPIINSNSAPGSRRANKALLEELFDRQKTSSSVTEYIRIHRIEHHQYAHHLGPWVKKHVSPELRYAMANVDRVSAYLQAEMKKLRKLRLPLVVTRLAWATERDTK